MNSIHRRLGTAVAAFALLLTMQGCANLEAVREFGKTAAEVSSLPDAGHAYEDSAHVIQPYLLGAPQPADTPALRERQVRDAAAVQASLAAYFAMLAKLAGEDAFSLDSELEQVGKGLQSLPSGVIDADTANAAIALSRTLQKYALARAQSQAVRALVTEGGPPAMRILDRLRVVTASWKGVVTNDRATVVGMLRTLTPASDTQPLLRVLGRERQAEVELDYAKALKRIDAATAGLDQVKQAHAEMVANLDKLDGDRLKAILKDAVADLKSVRKNIQSLK